MSLYTVYDATTGEVLRSGYAPVSMVAMQAGTGEATLEAAADDATQYVDLTSVPAIAAKQTMAPVTTITTGQVVLDGLPDPCIVACNGQEAAVTGGTVTLAFDLPGDYEVTLSAPPQYLEHTLTVTVP